MAVARYIVPHVPLIAQDLGMACWYASAQMLIQWRREKTQSTEISFPDPSDLPQTVSLYKANNGLSFSQMVNFAQLLGLEAVPLMSPTLDTVSDWLHDYGPIWTAGYKKTPSAKYGHVVVIVGVAPQMLRIHDPEPMSKGTREWKPLGWLDTVLEVGRSSSVVTNFLHFPG